MASEQSFQKNTVDLQLTEILDASPAGISWCNSEGDIEYANRSFTELLGYTIDDIPNIETWELRAYPDPVFREEVLYPWSDTVRECQHSGQPIPEFESNITCKDGSIRRVVTHVSWGNGGLLASFTDITAHWKTKKRNQAHNTVLEMIARNEDIEHILQAIVLAVESEDSSAMCSILLLDKDGKRLLKGAAPSLPSFFNDAVNGLEIGMAVGSCGTAAYTKKRVIVEDIATHEYWKDVAELAKRAKLAACWSEPILSSSGTVLGTFAIYHATPSAPTDEDIERITFAANLAVVAIENKNNREELIERERKFSSLAENAPDNIARYDTSGRMIYANPRLIETLGGEIERFFGRRPTEYVGTGRNESYEAALFKVLETGETAEVEFCISSKEGERIYHRVNMAAERDDSGKIISVLAIGRDITERRRMEKEIIRRDREFRSLADASPDNIIRYDKQCRMRYINRHLLDFFGFDSAERAIGRRPIEVWPDGSFQETEDSAARVIASGEKEVVELTIPQPDGEILYHHLLTVPERDDTGEIIGALSFGRNFTQLKRAEIALEKSNARFQHLFESSPDPVWIFDRDHFMDCNQAAVDMMGYSDKSQLLETPPGELSPPTQPDGEDSIAKALRLASLVQEQGLLRFEWVYRKATGELFTAEVTSSLIELEDRPVIYAVWRDITERKRLKQALEQRAHFDSLTGLANRQYFLEQMENELSFLKHSNGNLSLIMFDIDHFKEFNDTYGHYVGDLVLQSVAEIGRDTVRETDVVGRFGGEEFVVLLPHTRLEQAADIAERLRVKVEAGRVTLASGEQLAVTISSGVATYKSAEESTEAFLIRADAAMYAAKDSGRNRVCLQSSSH